MYMYPYTGYIENYCYIQYQTICRCFIKTAITMEQQEMTLHSVAGHVTERNHT